MKVDLIKKLPRTLLLHDIWETLRELRVLPPLEMGRFAAGCWRIQCNLIFQRVWHQITDLAETGGFVSRCPSWTKSLLSSVLWPSLPNIIITVWYTHSLPPQSPNLITSFDAQLTGAPLYRYVDFYILSGNTCVITSFSKRYCPTVA